MIERPRQPAAGVGGEGLLGATRMSRSARRWRTAAVTLAAAPLALFAMWTGFKAAVLPSADVPLAVHRVAPNTYFITGGISNMGFFVGDGGVVAIDAELFPKTAANALALIGRVTPKPVNAVVLSHSDPDHVDGLARFPAGIAVYSQTHTRSELLEALDSWRPSPTAPSSAVRRHLPTHLVESAASTVIDGVRVVLLHVAPAHTDGDLAVYLPERKVVFAGDLLTPELGPYPGIHLNKRGSSLGWFRFVEALLRLDADVFVSGHGGVLTKAELRTRLALSRARRAEIERLLRQGRSLKEARAILHDRPFAGVASRFPTFVETTYAELGSAADEAGR